MSMGILDLKHHVKMIKEKAWQGGIMKMGIL